MRTIQVGSRTLELDYDEGEYDTDLNDDDPSKEIVLSRQFHKIYQEMWATKTQNIVIKGSKGSGKSRVCAMWIIYNMMKYPKASTLVVRKFKESIKDSIYAELKWAIHKFHADGAWKCNTSPLEMSFTRDPSKPQEVQKILFRGLDDPQKVASIGVDYGHLCWVLWEEASQITSEEDFDKINMSIRGQLPDYLWKRVMVIFNPWSEKHWLKKRFFDEPDDRTYTLTTTFRHNPWLSDDNLAEYVELYDRSPRTARIICDGEWGIAGGLVYEDWEAADFDMTQVRAQYPDLRFSYGLDFGFVNDPTAFVAIAVDELSRQIWIFDCMYEYGWDNLKIARQLTQMGYADKVIACDSAEQKSIYELKRGYQTPALDENNDQIYDVDGHALTDTWVLPNAVMAMKGPDSIRNGIRDLQSYHLIVHRHKCVPVLDELSNYAFMEDKDGALTDQPMDEYNHCLVAGTMVETDHGAVPIEDIEVGDMVLTHLGYRKVLASGITRPEPAEIWKMTTVRGRVLEGTCDHPFPNVPEKPSHDDTFALKDGANKRLATLTGIDWVRSVEKTGRYEYVYDLTVDEAHDFFANYILVSNCCDSIRYAKGLLMGRGKGTVVETGESPVMIDTEPYTIKRLQPCSRVYSTYDEDDGESNGLTTQSGLSLSMYARSSVNGGTR